MGKASMQSDVAEVPLTRCASCGTVFEVPRELLEGPDTRVRCGECAGIFDARENLEGESAPLSEPRPAHRPPERVDAASLADDTAALDITYSDVDLFSEHADLPELHYLGDETIDTSAFDFGEPEFDRLVDDALLASDESAAADEEPDYLVDADDALSDANGRRPDALARPEPGGDDEADDANDADDADEANDADASSLASVDAVAPDAEGPGDGDPDADPASARADDAGTNGAVDGDASAGGPTRESDSDEGTDAVAATGLAAVDERRDADTPEAAAAEGAASAGTTLSAASIDGIAVPPTARRRHTALRVTLSVALCLLLGGLYLLRERERLHDNALLRPLLVGACRALGCSVPARVDLDALALLQKNVYAHPNRDGVLVVDVAFRNRASFEQRYPTLLVRLRDRVGRVVAAHEFAPTDYLDRWSADDTLAAGRRLDIDLEIDDPGAGADSYEFEFRESPP